MITQGFAFSYSDFATIGVNFQFPSSYLWINGDAGDIVYQAPDGSAQWFPSAPVTQLIPIAAVKILASGIVNGISRTTTATDIVYCSAPIY